MTKRRRLSDLYVRGRELSINDGDGEPVKVWMAKLNELDRAAALRRANAAKARYLIDGDDEDSDLFTGAYAEIREIEAPEELVLFVIADDTSKARRRIEAERMNDEGSWAKDGYLQGLLDAWNGDDDNPGLAKVKEEDANDPEAERVWKELERFQSEINEAMKAEVERLKKDWEDVEIESLRCKAAHKLVELRGTEEFIREFRRQQLFHGLRDPVNRRTRYFQTVSEIDDLDDELRGYLNEQYEDLMVAPVEGKGLRPVENFSNSSDSAELPSGPEEVAV